MTLAKEAREALRDRLELVTRHLDLTERQLRLLAGIEAKIAGNVSAVAEAIGVSRPTVYAGLLDLEESASGQPVPVAYGKVRRSGGGRKALTYENPTLETDLENLVAPTTRGDPESPLLWTTKSLRKLAEELRAKGHEISHAMVSKLLKGLGYTLQANAKTDEGSDHVDRDAQFQYIAGEVASALASKQPAVSVDAKKKELVGNYRNAGREWHPSGEPEEVKVYDFVDKELGRATPYGIYDIAQDEGWVNVGIGPDTAEFAVESLRRWWHGMGKRLYPCANKLLITADGGGSNGHRVRLWKQQLQKFADELGMSIQVCHFPPGTSKWNKIEHRLFSMISMNWRGRPLLSYQVIVNLIGSTRTGRGHLVHAELDRTEYVTKKSVSEKEFAEIRLERHAFHGEWNYTIKPRTEAGTDGQLPD